jgi:hypothetical protein
MSDDQERPMSEKNLDPLPEFCPAIRGLGSVFGLAASAYAALTR